GSTVPPGRNPPAPTSCVRAEVVPCPARSREDGTNSEGCGGPHGAARAGGPRGVSAADDLDRLAGDLELLVRGDDEDAHPAARRRDVARLTGASLVGGVVELDPEHVQTGERAGADLGRVLADAGGEHDRVDAAEGGRVGADVLAQPVAVDLERERGGLVTGLRGLDEVAHVLPPGQTEHAGPLVEQVVDLVG